MGLNVFLGAALHEEAQVHPEEETSYDNHGPGDPDVGRSRGEDQVSGTIPVFPNDEALSDQNGNSQPSMAAFHWVLLSLNGVPGLHIQPSLLECDVSECEPQ